MKTQHILDLSEVNAGPEQTRAAWLLLALIQHITGQSQLYFGMGYSLAREVSVALFGYQNPEREDGEFKYGPVHPNPAYLQSFAAMLRSKLNARQMRYPGRLAKSLRTWCQEIGYTVPLVHCRILANALTQWYAIADERGDFLTEYGQRAGQLENQAAEAKAAKELQARHDAANTELGDAELQLLGHIVDTGNYALALSGVLRRLVPGLGSMADDLTDFVDAETHIPQWGAIAIMLQGKIKAQTKVQDELKGKSRLTAADAHIRDWKLADLPDDTTVRAALLAQTDRFETDGKVYAEQQSKADVHHILAMLAYAGLTAAEIDVDANAVSEPEPDNGAGSDAGSSDDADDAVTTEPPATTA